MYLRESRQKRADGSVLTHLQLAENVWDPDKQRAQVKIIYSCGRADDPATTERLRRLGRSILRRCAPEEIVAENPSWQVVNAWPYGDLYVLEQLWRRLGIGEVVAEVCGGRKFDFDVERAREGNHRPRHLIEQRADLCAVIDIRIGQPDRNDPGQRTLLINTLRGHAAEFGVIAGKGPAKVGPLLAAIAQETTIPPEAKDMAILLGQQIADLDARIKEIEVKLTAAHKANAVSQRLATIPGVGPVTALTLAIEIDPAAFESGRHLAAWAGLTPTEHSTGGKQRMGGISRWQ